MKCENESNEKERWEIQWKSSHNLKNRPSKWHIWHSCYSLNTESEYHILFTYSFFCPFDSVNGRSCALAKSCSLSLSISLSFSQILKYCPKPFRCWTSLVAGIKVRDLWSELSENVEPLVCSCPTNDSNAMIHWMKTANVPLHHTHSNGLSMIRKCNEIHKCYHMAQELLKL